MFFVKIGIQTSGKTDLDTKEKKKKTQINAIRNDKGVINIERLDDNINI